MKKAVSFPYLLWMVAFTVVPLLFVAVSAFTSPEGTFTLDNLQYVAKYFSVFWKSIRLALISTILCLLIAYPLAYILSRKGEQYQQLFVMLLMLPMWINFLLRTYAWMTLLENEGLINHLLKLIGLPTMQLINTEGAVIIGMVYNYLPFMVLPLYTIMCKIDPQVIEAAQDLGANRLQVMARVVLPLSVPGIITGIMMVFVPSVSTFAISRMLGGGGNMLIGDLIEEQFLGGAYNPSVGAMLAFVLMIVILIIIGLTNKLDDEEKEGLLL